MKRYSFIHRCLSASEPWLPPWLLPGLLATVPLSLLLTVLREGDFYGYAVLSGLLVFGTGCGWRSLLLLLGAGLFWLSFPPLGWPSFLFCLTPVFVLWRTSGSLKRCLWEGFLFGFVASALTIFSALDKYPPPIWIGFSLLYGIQWLPLALAGVISRTWPVLLVAPFLAVVATAAEGLRSYWFGCLQCLFLPAAPTPLAQWASLVSPFGVSFLIYLLNSLWAMGWLSSGQRRWRILLVSGVLLAFLWVGGGELARQTAIPSLPLRILLIQPHCPHHNYSMRTTLLHQLTCAALAQVGTVDLVVWPEDALFGSDWESENLRALIKFSQQQAGASGQKCAGCSPTGILPPYATLEDFICCYLSGYQRSYLVGVVVRERGHYYNSACLITPDGDVERYDKVKLLWLCEWCPPFLEYAWIRRWYRALFRDQPVGGIEPGERESTLLVSNSEGQKLPFQVGICYEILFPLLSQYRDAQGTNLLITISNNSSSDQSPSFYLYYLWLGQYYAIHTRRWHCLVDEWSPTVVIDPRGQVRQMLNNESGWLYVDLMQEGKNEG